MTNPLILPKRGPAGPANGPDFSAVDTGQIPILLSEGVFGGLDPVVADDDLWTPTVFGGTTPGTQTYTAQFGGKYRLGKLAFIWGQVALATLDGAAAGAARIGTLPWTPRARTNEFFVLGVTLHKVALPASRIQARGLFNPSGYIALQAVGDNQTLSNIQITGFASDASVQFAGFYLTDDP